MVLYIMWAKEFRFLRIPYGFFLLSFVYFVTRDFILTPYYLSIFTSILTFVLFVIYFRKNTLALIIGCAILICSKSYIDFSTSGLESPLYNLLILFLIMIGEKICSNNNDERDIKKINIILSYAFFNILNKARFNYINFSIFVICK